MYVVDINCDLGESYGNYEIGNDTAILKYITSANIACGFHGGDPVVMDKTVKKALNMGVAIGAHPGFPDLMGFGRRNMDLTMEEVKAYIIYQVGALKGFVESYGGRLQHVKPHGALYNMAAKDYLLSRTIAEAIYSMDKNLILVGLANSLMIKAAWDVGLPVAEEVFADRNYTSEGHLISRNLPNGLVHNVEECYIRVLKMIKEKKIISVEGKEIEIKADTICIHGDHPQALDFLKELRNQLVNHDINIKSIGK